MLLPYWTDGCIGSQRGPLLRGVGHDAVPLPRRGGDVEEQLEPGARAAVQGQRRLRRACSTCRTSASSTTWRVTPEAIAQADRATRADRDRRQSGPWHIYEVGEQRHRDAADHTAGGRERAQRRPARAVARARHELVPEPGRVGRAARAVRPGRLAAHRRRAGRRPSRRRQGGRPGRRSTWCSPPPTIDPVALPQATVTNVDIGEQSVSFDVDDQDRCADARQGQLLPQLEGLRRRGPVPRRAEPDGGRPDLERRAP